MSRSSRPRPTDAELELLQALWELGPSTVREVHDRVVDRREVAYTTVLKLLQIMNDKGLVTRERAGRAHVYAPAEAREATQRRMVGDLLERAFSGSAAELAVFALEQSKSTPEELEQLRRLLEEHGS